MIISIADSLSRKSSTLMKLRSRCYKSLVVLLRPSLICGFSAQGETGRRSCCLTIDRLMPVNIPLSSYPASQAPCMSMAMQAMGPFPTSLWLATGPSSHQTSDVSPPNSLFGQASLPQNPLSSLRPLSHTSAWLADRNSAQRSPIR